MENRLVKLESDVTNIQSDVTHIKTYGIGFSAFFVVLIVGLVAGALNWQSHKFDRVEDKFDGFDAVKFYLNNPKPCFNIIESHFNLTHAYFKVIKPPIENIKLIFLAIKFMGLPIQSPGN